MTTLLTANFNDTLPAAPTGEKNVGWQADPGTQNPRNISAHVHNIGGVDPRTGTSETIALASRGMMVTLTNSSPVAVTIESEISVSPPVPMPSDFMCWIVNEGAGLVTVTPSSGTIDGQANVQIAQRQAIAVFFDGINWKTDRGLAPSVPVMVGSNGSAGTAGLVPAPSAGMAAAGRYLKASGTWEIPPATGPAAYVNTNGDTHPSSPNALDDEFEEGALSSQWTNANSAPVSLSEGSLVFSAPGQTGNNWTWLYQALPSGTFRLACKMTSNPYLLANSGLYGGMLMSDGTKIKFWGFQLSGGTIYFLVRNYSNRTTSAGNVKSTVYNSGMAAGFGMPPMYFAIHDDGSNWLYELSLDGITWVTYASEAHNSYLTPTQIGIAADNATASTQSYVDFDWFRRLL